MIPTSDIFEPKTSALLSKHMAEESGAAYLIVRRNDGGWNTKKVLATELGVPRLRVGYSGMFIDDEKDYIVVTFESDYGIDSALAITADGVVYHLGEVQKQEAKKILNPPR